MQHADGIASAGGGGDDARIQSQGTSRGLHPRGGRSRGGRNRGGVRLCLFIGMF